MLSIRGYLSDEMSGTNDPSEFQTPIQHGYVATTALETPYIVASQPPGLAAVVDLTKPAALQWFQGM